MLLHYFHTSGLSINTYLIGDAKTGQAAIIDPTRDVEPYIRYAHQRDLEITDIVETHVHADFISGSRELKHGLHGRPVIHCSAMGGEEWIPSYTDRKVYHGDELKLGSIRLRALHTPGHTPEHIIWVCYDLSQSSETPCMAFTGDLLFVGSIGRPDLLGTSEMQHLIPQLYHSLFVAIRDLPDFLEIFPGHGAGSLCGKFLQDRPSTTLGYEKRFNPFLIEKPLEKWAAELQQDMPGAPSNFLRMKKINAQGPLLLSETNEKKDQLPLIIDVRIPDCFAAAHLAGSLNIPLGNSFCNWVGSVIVDDIALGVIAETHEQLDEAVKELSLIGFDQVISCAVWDEDHLKKEFAIETAPQMQVNDLAEQIKKSPRSCYVLDVRTDAEWKAGHIEGAHHLELAHLLKNSDQLPKNIPIKVICASGYRASVATSLLKNKGFAEVANIAGGMTAWKEAKLSITV